MRTKIVAGNWKMNKTLSESVALASAVSAGLEGKTLNHTRVIVAPAMLNVSAVASDLSASVVEVAAQNVHQASSGAYTGEVSIAMLQAVGVATVILGHSERRAYFGEEDALLKEKVSKALDAGLEVIFCFGELLEDRKSDRHFEVVEKQLRAVLFDLAPTQWRKIVLAYEPVWAIGTGETATADQAQEMHAFIRQTIAKVYEETLASGVSILYGGSCKPSNAKEIFAGADVDGGLIGGASLQAADFLAIVAAL